MRLTIERNPLHEALQRLSRVIEARNTIPILSHVLMRAGADGALNLAATNMNLDARAVLTAEIHAPGSYAVPGDRLAAIVAALPAGAPISMEIDKDRLTLKSGKSKFTMVTLPAHDFPEVTMPDGGKTFDIGARELSRLIASTEPFCTDDASKAQLMGVYLGAGMSAVATDGYRMSIASIPSQSDPFSLILPRKAAREVRALCDKIQSNVKINLNANNFRTIFADGFMLTSRLIDETFPDYQRILPRGNTKIVTVEGKTLIGSINKLNAMSSEVKSSVHIEITEGTLVSRLVNQDHGDACDEIECEYSGDPISVRFNIKYFSDVLTVLNADTVQMKFGEGKVPTIISNMVDDGLTMLLMQTDK